jgi:hypothetical protein
MNEVRKNVALSKRNVASGSINTALASNRVFDNAAIVSLGGKLIFENTGSTTTRVNYEDDVMGRFVNTGSVYEPVYSVIAIGADVYIDKSVIPQNDGKPRAIIAIKNDA